ncbi:hypothetical protein [Actinacidiphila sp. bgisy160]|uniref:hypothetical protein n=1 Tax=Actinacidiphila sp. bgisy160 TaxID=3413796 RepID=UPI003D7140B2
MNKWTRIIATSTASVALAGTALLGATGSASAAPRPSGQDRQTVTVSSTPWDRNADRGGNNDRRWHDEITRHHYDYGHHQVQYWYGYDGKLYRYDGHRLARWSHGHWVTVWQSHGHGPVR